MKSRKCDMPIHANVKYFKFYVNFFFESMESGQAGVSGQVVPM